VNQVATVTRGQLAKFKPAGAGVRVAAHQAIAEAAKRMREWKSLWKAVDDLLDEQRCVVEWWDALVTPNKGGDRKSANQKRRSALLVSDAEKLIEATHQQVSKWRKWLKREDEYWAVLAKWEQNLLSAPKVNCATPLPPAGQYSVVLADPPWPYDDGDPPAQVTPRFFTKALPLASIRDSRIVGR
jgi:hypothetical protein